MHSDVTIQAPEIDAIVRDALETIDVEPDDLVPAPSALRPPPLPRVPLSDASVSVGLADLEAPEFPYLEVTERIPSSARMVVGPSRTLVMPPSSANLEASQPFVPPPVPTSPPPRLADLLEPEPCASVRPFAPPPAPAFAPPSFVPAPVPATRPASAPPRRRRAVTPYLALAAVAALGGALWLDPDARGTVVVGAREARAHAEAIFPSRVATRAESSTPAAEPSAASMAPAPVELADVSWQPSSANAAWRLDARPSAGLTFAPLVVHPPAPAVAAAPNTRPAHVSPAPVQATRPARVVSAAAPPKVTPARTDEDEAAASVVREAKVHLETSLDR
jgi:hypothetical protein